MDVVAMFEPVTKWATSILHADTIPEIVRKAVRLARTEKARRGAYRAAGGHRQTESDAEPLQPRRFRRYVPDDKIVDRAFDMLHGQAAGDPGRQRLYPQQAHKQLRRSASAPASA